MKYILISILIVFFNISYLYSQKRQLIILDSISKLPVKYANIDFLNGFGVFSSENGGLMITDVNINLIEISHVSYESKKIDFKKLKDSILYLKPRVIQLNEVAITTNSKLKIRKTLKTNLKGHHDFNKMYYSAVGLKLAFKINLNDDRIKYLKSIEIPLFTEANDATKKIYPEKKYPYKTLIKIEILDCVNDMPGDNLYNYINYEVINSELIKDSFTSNFEKNIKIPENGLFVVVTFIGKVDENNFLNIEMPYDINTKFPDAKFIKWILPNIPIVERQNDTKTLYRFDYEKESNWKQIEKPSIYFKNKEYPIFDVGIGYKIDLME
jgi:hypothetical protein